VIYEASVPRVHTYRIDGRHRCCGITRRATAPRPQRREKESIAHQHEIGRTAADNDGSTRSTGHGEDAIDCDLPKDAGNSEKL
jgi:hypothetical protein